MYSFASPCYIGLMDHDTVGRRAGTLAECIERYVEPGCLVSETVVDAVAQLDGIDPLDLPSSLYEAVDPDALDELFGNGTKQGAPESEIRFQFAGHLVVVTGDGRVQVS